MHRRIRWGTLACGLAFTSAAGAQQNVPPMTKATNIESSYPFWSPDARQLVFQSDRNGNSDIYISGVDGTSLRRLTDHPADDLTPAWSPDGRLIVFQSNRDGNEELYLINPDGTGLRNLTRHRANDGHPKWSPDSRRIIFNSNRGADTTSDDIYEVDLDGGDLRRLTHDQVMDTYPSISPDGRRILWRRVTDTPGFDGSLGLIQKNSEIFVRDRDGTGGTNLSSHAAYDGWPAWSSDGAWIAFSSNRSGRFQVHIMRADGSDTRQLTYALGSFTKPSWSADGARIVCTRTLDGNVELFIIEIGTGSPAL